MSKSPMLQMGKAKRTQVILNAVRSNKKGATDKVKIEAMLNDEKNSVICSGVLLRFKRYPIFNYFLIIRL
jgi:hypothetical protein